MLGFFRRKWPEIPFDEIRKRARILVVDDQDFAYRTLFERDGYTLEKWSDIERLSDLEEGAFDVILLDLQGVGRQESADQGFGVLRHLREKAPAQIIVAYSNADWGLQYQEFFKLADAVLPKSADYMDFKRQIDELLTKRFSLGFYVNRVLREASSLDIDPGHLRREVEKAILKQDPKKLRRLLEREGVSSVQIDRLLSIVSSAIGILKLWIA